MAYRYVTAKLVAVQPQHAGKPVSLEMWGKLAVAGVQVDKDNGLYLERHEITAKRRGGNSWEKAKQAAHNAIAKRHQQILESPYYSDPANHFIVDIIYAREG